jgi:hypothetical protein
MLILSAASINEAMSLSRRIDLGHQGACTGAVDQELGFRANYGLL